MRRREQRRQKRVYLLGRAFFIWVLFLFIISSVYAQAHGKKLTGHFPFSKKKVGEFKLGRDKENRVDVKVECLFSEIPPSGFIPLLVTIHNHTSREKTFTLSFVSESYSSPGEKKVHSRFVFASLAQHEQQFEICVPVMKLSSSSHSSLRVAISGGGYRRKTLSHYYNHTFPTVVMGVSMAKNENIENLNAKYKEALGTNTASHLEVPFGAVVDPAFLPSDWRGFTGIDLVMLSDEEWLTAKSAARNALLQWNRLGGVLYIYSDKKDITLRALGIPGREEQGGKKMKRSFGEVQLLSWQKESIDAEATYAQYEKSIPKRKSVYSKLLGDWELKKALGTRPFRFGFILSIIICFGIIVGPVNLFGFAKSGRRHRLFITTPLISFAASLLLFLFITFQDGFGGEGRRFVAMNLQPGDGENSAYILQEQVSHTGALFSTKYRTAESVYSFPLRLAPSPWVKFTEKSSNNFSLSDRVFHGDWFRSRSEQAQFIKCVRSTRGRIEKVSAEGSTVPELISQLNFSLQTLFYVDKEGRYWLAEGKGVGEKFKMKRSSEEKFSKWMEQHIGLASLSLQQKLNTLKTNREFFFAAPQADQAIAIETLPSIRWKEDRCFIFGPVVNRAVSSLNP